MIVAGGGRAINAPCCFVKIAQEFSVLPTYGAEAEGSFHLVNSLVKF